MRAEIRAPARIPADFLSAAVAIFSIAPGIAGHQGDTADAILETATEVGADLIVMTTDGLDGFLDGLRGSTSERVLSKAHCPVISLPVGSMLG